VRVFRGALPSALTVSAGRVRCGVVVAAVLAAGGIAGCGMSSSEHQHTQALSATERHTIAVALRASLPLDSNINPTSSRTFSTTCSQIDRGDPLLRAFRKWCLGAAAVATSQASFSACVNVAGSAPTVATGNKRVTRCQAGVAATTAGVLHRFVLDMESFNRAVDQYVPSPSCRRALRGSPSELSYYREMAPAFTRYASGLRGGSAKAQANAGTEAQQVAARFAIRTHHTQLSEFQHNCS